MSVEATRIFCEKHDLVPIEWRQVESCFCPYCGEHLGVRFSKRNIRLEAVLEAAKVIVDRHVRQGAAVDFGPQIYAIPEQLMRSLRDAVETAAEGR